MLVGAGSVIALVTLLVIVTPSAEEQQLQAAARSDVVAASPPGAGDVALVPVPVAAPANAPDIDDARARELTLARCEAEYPDDLALRGGCKRNAERRLASYREIAARYAEVPDMQRALAGCMADYPDDFALLGGCARNNERGLQSISE